MLYTEIGKMDTPESIDAVDVLEMSESLKLPGMRLTVHLPRYVVLYQIEQPMLQNSCLDKFWGLVGRRHLFIREGEFRRWSYTMRVRLSSELCSIHTIKE
jgi:hypothetical protein